MLSWLNLWQLLDCNQKSSIKEVMSGFWKRVSFFRKGIWQSLEFSIKIGRPCSRFFEWDLNYHIKLGLLRRKSLKKKCCVWIFLPKTFSQSIFSDQNLEISFLIRIFLVVGLRTPFEAEIYFRLFWEGLVISLKPLKLSLEFFRLFVCFSMECHVWGKFFFESIFAIADQTVIHFEKLI